MTGIAQAGTERTVPAPRGDRACTRGANALQLGHTDVAEVEAVGAGAKAAREAVGAAVEAARAAVEAAGAALEAPTRDPRRSIPRPEPGRRPAPRREPRPVPRQEPRQWGEPQRRGYDPRSPRYAPRTEYEPQPSPSHQPASTGPEPSSAVAAPSPPPLPVALPRPPFLVLILSIVVGGVLGVLVLNTKINENSFRLDSLRDQQAALDLREEQLSQALADRESTGNLRAAAIRLGLVPAGEPAFITLPNGQVVGVPQPATGSTNASTVAGR